MFFLLFACSGDPTPVDPGDTNTPDDTGVPNDTGTPDSGTPGDTGDTADTGSDAFSWDDICSETPAEPMEITGPSEAFDAFIHSIVNVALHTMVVSDVLYEGEKTGCPLLTSIDEYTTEITGGCESFIGSTYSGSLRLTNTPTTWTLEATEFSTTSNIYNNTPFTYSVDGWQQYTWTETHEEYASTMSYTLDGEMFEGFNGSLYQNVRGGSESPDEERYSEWLEGYVSASASPDRAIGDACVAWTYERSATCEDEGNGYLAVLGAQEAWLVTSEEACDGCYEVTLDGVEQEDYCR